MTPEETEASHRAFYELSKLGVELGGTISAEHGVGKKSYDEDGVKRPYLYMMYGEQGLRETAMTKHQLDPAHILNRGNMVPESYLDDLEQ
jgi:FAD/FMN-containing dehydrogenase